MRQTPRSMRAIILWKVLPITTTLLVIIWLSVKYFAADTVRREVEKNLLIQAEQAAESTDRKLSTLLETVHGLSQNILIISGLIDPSYRNNYLPSFLQSLRMPGAGDFAISLIDHQGRTIVSNRDRIKNVAPADWFISAMAGHEFIRASQDGIRIALPVFYKDLPRGVLTVKYDREALAELVKIDSPDVAYIVMENDNTVIFSSHESFSGNFDTRNQGWLYEIVSIANFPNLLVVGIEDEETAFKPLVELDHFLMAALILEVGALFFGVIFAALQATRPLSRFIDQIEYINKTGDLSHRISEKDFKSRELLFLVNSFNTFIKQIEAYQNNLQNRVHERTAELEESEIRLRSILDTVLTGIVTIDSDRRIETFNPAAERIFGYKKSEVKNKLVTILMPPEIAEQHDFFMDRYQATGEKRIIDVGGREVTGRRKDGTVFPLDLAVTDMGANKFAGVFTDITDRKKHEAELKDAKETAEAANRIKMEFLTMMSHELKTPLSVMDNLFQEFGNVDIFTGARDLSRMISGLTNDENADLQAALDDLINEINELSDEGRDAGKRLLDLIKDTLDFSRIEAGKLQIELDSIGLKEYIEKAVREIRPLSNAKGLELSTRISDATVRADSHRLLQVLANLLSNAVKFTETGTITITASVDGNFAQIDVSDTGSGIPPEKFGVIFSAFEQVDMSATRKHGGTGLGMPISKRLVEQMGGKIWFNSKKGEGTTFCFTLPLVKD